MVAWNNGRTAGGAFGVRTGPRSARVGTTAGGLVPAVRSWPFARRAAVCLAVAGLATAARANSGWTGAVNQDWNNLGNWSSNPNGDYDFVNTATGNYPTLSVNSTFTPLDLNVGSGGTGRVTHNAGSLSMTGWMYVGRDGGTGTYDLANAAATGGATTGYGQGAGNLTVGTNANGRLYVGGFNGSTGTGTFKMNTAGTLAADFLVLGDSNTVAANGTFDLDNGTVNVGSELWAGNGGNGTFRMSGGTLNTGSWFSVGRASNNIGTNGVFDLTGGTVNAVTNNGTAFTTIGSFGPGNNSGAVASGTLNVSGGLFTSTRNIAVGEFGVGTLNVSGTGQVVTTNADNGGLQLARGSGSTGTVNLNGGTLAAAVVTKGVGTGTFYFNGGTLKAASNAVSGFMGGLTNAYVRNGGAILDTNGKDVTVAQPLLHSATGGDTATDGGFTKNGTGTLTMTGASSYTGNVVVNGGTLNAALNTNNGFSGQAVGALGNQKYAGKTVTINNGATVLLTTGNVLGDGGTPLADAPLLKFVVNAGGTLRTGANDTGGGAGGDANVFGPVELRGGTFTVGNGYSSTYQAAVLLGTITAGGTAASTINKDGNNGNGNGLNLGDAAAGTDAITFDVADATANANADLTVNARLYDSAGGGAAVGALIKTGVGTLALDRPDPVSAGNAYAGGTTINAGTLRAVAPRTLAGNTLTHSATGTGTVTVANGGTLAGTGGTGDVVVQGGGTLAAGSGPTAADTVGTLSTGRQNWAGGGRLVAKASGPAAGDLQSISGLLNLSGVSAANKFVLSLVSLAGTLPGGNYKLASATNGISLDGTTAVASGTPLTSLFVLNVNGIAVPAADYSVTAGLTSGGNPGDLFVTYNAAPEPSVAALAGLAATTLLGRRKRR